MKKTYALHTGVIALAALNCLIWGQAIDWSKSNTGVTKIDGNASLAITSNSIVNGLGMTADQPPTGITYASALTIHGFKTYLRLSKMGLGWEIEEIKQPKKPDEIVVLLNTADGRRWRAIWVQDVP